MSAVALLGLGAMGQRMAVNLLQAGHELAVWNRSVEPCAPLIEQGAMRCVTPREAAQRAEIVIAMLRDDQASRAVWLDASSGALAGLRPAGLAIESSTLSLECCGELAAAVQRQGADFLDAPVVGSRAQAEARQLIHLVGGAPACLERARPALAASAATVHHVGDACSGMAMKLAVNALFCIQVAALGELLALLGHCGIDTQLAAELFGQLPVTSPAAKGAGMGIVAQDYAPRFPIQLVDKDFAYALAAADSHNAPLPTTAAVRAQFSRAIRQGYGDENIHAVAKLFLMQDDDAPSV